ncbi:MULTISPECIES: hypothetical protein [Pseudoalteromonas]|jgi:hypothetical protein|uniref:Lipoprotein n=2 Tax=Pseudoalteromonas TaxID=53246 RepID=A0A0P7DR92_9GAMM|nr:MULTISPECIES: hypothetical protein [Pseudoalteromonas]MAH28603.1 hypothetical protein [Pseudoalteromonadaceae bacterium]MED5511286.1 hypothetical protein [Pseudomonadota bacterium]KPM81322.1 hypothetical protein AOG27_18495 [Pseudoalteromonas lipolytica]MBC7008613.1 hypothetical protein [Pseudoalteromonas sp. BZK2]MCF2916995.1 hypothetical protein [Pseudoalteromonas sp. Cn5-37]|tara:strand:+ start:320 stop:685 length:366 start_codon:yes stop_codon:yes gene_type:complete
MSELRSTQALLISAVLMLAGCSNAQAAKGETEKLYDFDEKVHYYQTKLADGRYHLEIQSDDYKHFRNQSVFLLRHASRLCRDKPFMLRVTDGVQEYERFPTKPRAYQPPLTVVLQCEDEAK